MPVGSVDYRARLRGPGTQDAIGFMLRLLSMPGKPDAAPVDPETGRALQGALGIPPAAPKLELRPDEIAAEADRKAREAYQRMLGY